MLSVAVCLLLISRCSANWGDPFGLISRVQTYCELDSMNTASKLSDIYNSLDESARKMNRMKHEYVMEHLGFGWEHSHLGRRHGETQAMLIGGEATAAQTKGGWVTTSGVPQSYKLLENKWVYFYGDHSLRQLAAAFVYPMHGKEMLSSKEWTTSKCAAQEHRVKEEPAPTVATASTADADSSAPESKESKESKEGTGHVGHNYRAKTCTFPGFGENGKITYDWKHAPFDEYAQWLFGSEGLWTADGSGARPDYLVVQAGHSTCLPAFDATRGQTELQHGVETFNAHVAQVDQLMDALKAVVARPGPLHSGAPGNTTVIISTAPRSAVGHTKSEYCTWKLNRIIARAAHHRGFIVLEREEIEHRLSFKLEASEDLIASGAMEPAEPPAAQVVSTVLLSMMQCLAKNESPPASL